MKPHLTFRETVKILLHHRKLADQRNFSSTANKFAKAMIYLSMSLIVVYLIALSIPFAMIANESRNTTAAELLMDILPFMLTLDFFMRFLIQQTPSQIVRPYLLLPLPRYACINAFVYSSVLSWGNLTWLLFVIPYCLMSVMFSYGLATTLTLITLTAVLTAANSQWYSIARTLINDSFLWWLLPIAVYAIAATPLYVGSNAGFDQFGEVYSIVGSAIDHHNPTPLIVAIILLAALIYINRSIQFKYVQRELTYAEKKTEVKRVNKFTFLERYGELGSFLQLEIKLLMRNSNPRKAFYTGILTIVFISVLIIACDIYDSVGMTNFWGLYNFILLGSTILIRIMGYEGNYIDCLLVHRENILMLLRAKYLFYSLLIILPFVLMLPVVISGKWSLYMLISYAIFTIGFQYFMLFQIAVYNKQTIPLNEKLTSKGGLDGNYLQMAIMAGLFIIPNALVGLLQNVFSDNVAYSVMLIIGLAFIATHRLWLRNIYNRIMNRKYSNLESFSATR